MTTSCCMLTVTNMRGTVGSFGESWLYFTTKKWHKPADKISFQDTEEDPVAALTTVVYCAKP